jgi:hypothetical protein
MNTTPSYIHDMVTVHGAQLDGVLQVGHRAILTEGGEVFRCRIMGIERRVTPLAMPALSPLSGGGQTTTYFEQHLFDVALLEEDLDRYWRARADRLRRQQVPA